MPTYSVSAVDRRGIRRSFREVAPNEPVLQEKLRARQLWPVAVREAKGNVSPRSTLPTEEFVAILDQLELMLRAGITADVALRQMAVDTPAGKAQRMLARIAEEVGEGKSIHAACGYFGRQFPPHVIAVIAAGETAARLPESLRALAEHLTQAEEIGRTARRALIYPAMVFGATAALVVFLLASVVPKFAEIFRSLNLPLPMMTRVLIAASEGVRAAGWTGWGFVVGGAFALWFGRKTRAVRRLVDPLGLRLPGWGETIRCLVATRVAAVCRLLHDAGVPVLDSLESAAKVADHVVVERQLLAARAKVGAGTALHVSLSGASGLPSFVVPLLKAGESTGQLGAAWRQVEDYAARKARQRLAVMLALLEPALLAVLTGVVGAIALSFFLPLFSLLGGLNAR
ncbi:MAG: type II secretion system F family protein [Candidatus Didemnitutus sp.]|nr:type II secretion system F family protein [Candidatus Didemnitutus sp.]